MSLKSNKTLLTAFIHYLGTEGLHSILHVRLNDMSDNIQLENREQQHQGQREQQDQQLSEEEAERQHWINVMRTFLLYGDFVLNDLVRRQQHLGRLSDSYASHLPRVSFDKWDAIKHASEANQIYFDDMVEFHFNSTCNDPSEKMPKKYEGPRIHPQQHHRNQVVR